MKNRLDIIESNKNLLEMIFLDVCRGLKIRKPCTLELHPLQTRLRAFIGLCIDDRGRKRGDGQGSGCIPVSFFPSLFLLPLARRWLREHRMGVSPSPHHLDTSPPAPAPPALPPRRGSLPPSHYAASRSRGERNDEETQGDGCACDRRP